MRKWPSSALPKAGALRAPLMAPEPIPSPAEKQAKEAIRLPPEAKQQDGSSDAIGVKDAEAKRRRRSWLVLYTVLLVLSSVGNTVCFKQMTSAMPNYGWYLTQLSSVIYLPVFWTFAATLKADRSLLKRFAVMGVFDGLAGILSVLGGIHTSGTLQVLITQLVIPCTLFLSMFLLGKRFHALQHLGATSIVVGIVLATARSGGNSGDNNMVFVTMFSLAILPASLSSIFKEVAFKGFDGDLDIYLIQFWVAAFQVIVNFLAMPIYSLKALGPQQVPFEHMLDQAEGGTRCLFLLQDSVVTDCGLPGQRPCDHCGMAWRPVLAYLCFNCFYNIFTMLVIKHGSAALSFLVSTLRMPLSSVAFSSPLIMGQAATQLSIADLMALVVIITGLSTYRYGSRQLKRQRQQAENALTTPASPRSSWFTPSPSEKGQRDDKAQRGPKYAPVFTLGVPGAEPVFVLLPAQQQRPAPRTAERLRSDLLMRLGTASPLDSPKYRPPATPSEASQEDVNVDFALEGLPSEVNANAR